MQQMKQFKNSDALVESCPVYQQTSPYFTFTAKGWEEIKRYAPYALQEAHAALGRAKNTIKNPGAFFFKSAFTAMQTRGEMPDLDFAFRKLEEKNLGFDGDAFENLSIVEKRLTGSGKAGLGSTPPPPSNRASSRIFRSEKLPSRTFADEKAGWLAAKEDPIALKRLVLQQGGLEKLEAFVHEWLEKAAVREGLVYDYQPIFLGATVTEEPLPAPVVHDNPGYGEVITTPHGPWLIKKKNILCVLDISWCNGAQCRECKKLLGPTPSDPDLEAAIDESFAIADDLHKQPLAGQQEAFESLAKSLSSRFKFE